jgi:Zn-dependent protease with chaperone function
MIIIRGFYYDGQRSAQIPARCCFYDNGAIKVEGLDDHELLASLKSFTISVSPRLANTPRYLHLPNQGKFETEENDLVDKLLRRFGRRSWLNVVHYMETRKRWILTCLLAIVLMVWFVGRYGVPFAAKVIAGHLPKKMTEMASQKTIDTLDQSLLHPSQLDAAVMERLKAHFRPIIEEHREYHIHVLFRDSKGLGANAFALPDGTVIFTDEMVKLSVNDNELLAVLAHEIGHVVHRHGLQTLVQNSLFAFVVLAITGDVHGTSQIFLGLPVLLTELSYSRAFEREADNFALSYLKQQSIAPVYFANLMRRVEEKRGARSTSSDDLGHGRTSKSGWRDFLSTHPSMKKRLRRFEQ